MIKTMQGIIDYAKTSAKRKIVVAAAQPYGLAAVVGRGLHNPGGIHPIIIGYIFAFVEEEGQVKIIMDARLL